jgi:hypothetical protein
MRTPFLEFLVIFFRRLENQRSLYWIVIPQVKVVIVRLIFYASSRQMDRPARKDWKLFVCEFNKDDEDVQSCVLYHRFFFLINVVKVYVSPKLELVQRRINIRKPSLIPRM